MSALVFRDGRVVVTVKSTTILHEIGNWSVEFQHDDLPKWLAFYEKYTKPYRSKAPPHNIVDSSRYYIDNANCLRSATIAITHPSKTHSS